MKPQSLISKFYDFLIIRKDLKSFSLMMLELLKKNLLSSEYYDIYRLVQSNDVKFTYVIKALMKSLMSKHYTVVYPLDMIVVPRYPFTKVPMISWMDLGRSSPYDKEVVEVKELCSRLGNLINVGFVLRGYVLIDIDTDLEEVKNLSHVRTRRGYHIILKLKEGLGLKFIENKVESFKKVIITPKGKLEIMSGPLYLGSHPLQSRFLEIKDGKVNIRSYKILKEEVLNAFKVGDTSLLEVDVKDLRNILSELLNLMSSKYDISKLTILPVKSLEELKVHPDTVTPPTSRFNVSPKKVIGLCSYSEFKDLLKKCMNLLPRCFKEALFGYPPEGSRWYHLRLLVAVLPHFVIFSDTNIEELVKDYQERVGKRPSEFREWLYTIKYYTGILGDVRAPSVYGVPNEAWDTFQGLGWCKECILKSKCLSLRPNERRKLIVSHINDLVVRHV